jgi:hypothetical protein
MTSWTGSLLVGGQFLTAGGLPVQGLARWDGSVWSAFHDERAAGPWSLAVLNGSLYSGGSFLIPGSTTQRTGILRWADPAWVSIGGNPPNDDVYAITLYRGQLIVGGYFTSPTSHIALFDGATWQPLGAGLNGIVNALAVFDPDGPGPLPDLLIAGGSFSAAGAQPASNIAVWDGSQWSPLGMGTSSTVRALTTWNNQLVVAGDFGFAGGIASPALAFYGCPQPAPCYPNCDASTAAPVLNVNDFLCFLNAFAAASPYANCDNSTLSPTLNVVDFICFLNKFAAGCS